MKGSVNGIRADAGGPFARADARSGHGLAIGAASPFAYHLKIDSGMGRLGTRAAAAEILDALGRTPHSRLEGLMTHFASAAD